MGKQSIIGLSIFLVFLPSVFTSFYPGKIIVVSFVCCLATVAALSFVKGSLSFSFFEGKTIIKLFCVYSLWVALRAYWNILYWKDIAYVFTSPLLVLSCLLWLLCAREDLFPCIIRALLVWGCLTSVRLCYVPPSNAMMTMQHNMLWVCLCVFMHKYVKRRTFIMVLMLSFGVVSFSLDHRSIMLNFIVAYAILLFFSVLRRYRKLIFAASSFTPTFMLILFIVGKFNVFSYFEEKFDGIRLSETSERELMVDSRTGIYKDVIAGTILSGDVYHAFVGLGANGRVLSENNGVSSEGVEGYRNECESGMLNQLQTGGVVGVVMYSLLILGAAFYAIFRSNNVFVEMVGFFLLFKYVYSFIEDQVMFNAHTYFTFLLIGIGYNKEIRRMNDVEMSHMLRDSVQVLSTKRLKLC